MTWRAPQPPADPPSPDVGDVRPILQGYLDHHRLTLLRLCAGLTAEQLALRSTPPSTLSLLGLVRHMTKVERTWLRIRTAGQDIDPLFPDSDEDFDDLDPAAAEQAPHQLVDRVGRMRRGSRALTARVLRRRARPASYARLRLHPPGRGMGAPQRARRPHPPSYRRNYGPMTNRPAGGDETTHGRPHQCASPSRTDYG